MGRGKRVALSMLEGSSVTYEFCVGKPIVFALVSEFLTKTEPVCRSFEWKLSSISVRLPRKNGMVTGRVESSWLKSLGIAVGRLNPYLSSPNLQLSSVSISSVREVHGGGTL